MTAKKILILGVSGMIGHVLFRQLVKNPQYHVVGTLRNFSEAKKYFSPGLSQHIFPQPVDAQNFTSIEHAVHTVQPHILINCVGLIKQLPLENNTLATIILNAELPHRLANLCKSANARMLHFSTDCIFNGEKGAYTEEDISNAEDLYGRTKYLGEVTSAHCLTLRTSFIGHELRGRYGLVEWFLAQHDKVRGFSKAIYSGLPTVEIAKLVSEYVLPNEKLNGLYHVSSDPISKYELLQLLAQQYEKKINIEEASDFVQDRSLDSTRFRTQTGYLPPTWPELVALMHEDYQSSLEAMYVQR